MNNRIAPLPTENFQPAQSFSGDTIPVAVSLSSSRASATEEADALLSSLGFKKSDVEAFNKKYDTDLRQKFINEFSSREPRPTRDFSPKPCFQTYIGVSRRNLKIFKEFLAERRSATPTQAKSEGNGAAKIGDRSNQAKQEQIKLNNLLKDAQILPASFGTPSKLRDLKHIAGAAMPSGGDMSAEDAALAGYIEQRYGDRSNLYGDDKADILQIAKNNGVKIENLSVKNGKAEFDLSVESLLKLHIAYLGVQEKANITEAAVKDQQNNSAFNQFLVGVGEGAWNNLKDTGEALTHPINTLHGICEGAKAAGSIAVDLAKMSEPERMALYAQLSKAGLTGLGGMTAAQASRQIGKFVGSLAVDVALGKPIGKAILLLKDLQLGSKIIKESVELSKTIKQTLGNIKVPLSDMKVVSDTTGNKWWIRDGELKKLEDVVKMMKSSDESLEILKGGSTAGREIIKETAEKGLSETAQSGLKALRGTLSKEGLAEVKEQLVTLSVARVELLARIDKLIANNTLLQDTKGFLLKTKNSLLNSLKQEDLVGALRDEFGRDVRRSGDGKIFQHLEEVNQGLRSIENSKSALVKEIARTQKGSNEYKIISQEIEALSELTRRIRRFLEIK